MKIRGGGNPYLNNIAQSQKTEKTNKSKGTKKAKSSAKAEETSAVSTAEPLAPADEVDSPIYDELVSAATQYNEEDLEEATRTVVSAVIREHFGKKGLTQAEVDAITDTVSSSVHGDDTLRNRLEVVLQRITAKQKRSKG